MKLGEVLGWINTRIILSVLFWVLIVPAGLLMRAFKRGHIREMDAQQGGGSLRQLCSARPRHHFERIF
jgi:hypothetical protein